MDPHAGLLLPLKRFSAGRLCDTRTALTPAPDFAGTTVRLNRNGRNPQPDYRMQPACPQWQAVDTVARPESAIVGIARHT